MVREGHIVVLDSGIGGISLLYTCYQKLPRENFIYYGDIAFAPYGDRTKEQVAARVMAKASAFFQDGCKALVLACNTATSAAARQLRESWPDKPVIGLEPALKPAVETYSQRDIVVLATSLTIQEEKFQTLYGSFKEKAHIIPLACPGLMNLVEEEQPEAEIIRYLEQKIAPFIKTDNVAFVIGCTHYIFLQPLLKRLWPQSVLVHGNKGAANYLIKQLEEKNLLRKSFAQGSFGNVIFTASSGEEAFQDKCGRFWRRMDKEGLDAI